MRRRPTIEKDLVSECTQFSEGPAGFVEIHFPMTIERRKTVAGRVDSCCRCSLPPPLPAATVALTGQLDRRPRGRRPRRARRRLVDRAAAALGGRRDHADRLRRPLCRAAGAHRRRRHGRHRGGRRTDAPVADRRRRAGGRPAQPRGRDQAPSCRPRVLHPALPRDGRRTGRRLRQGRRGDQGHRRRPRQPQQGHARAHLARRRRRGSRRRATSARWRTPRVRCWR